jgi:hypothetical protein
MGRACSTHGEKRNAYRILVGKPEGILKWILERKNAVVLAGLICLRIGTSGGLL